MIYSPQFNTQAGSVPLLLGGYPTARQRLGHLGFLIVCFSLPAILWHVFATFGVVSWPSSSGTFGLALGIVGALMIAFEMLIWPRKKLRRLKLGKTSRWMAWHIWIGLAVGPVGVIHSGYHWGGPLTTTLMVLFLGVLISGIWGLALQQTIPQTLLDAFPNETIEGQADAVMKHHLAEAMALRDRLPKTDPETKAVLDLDLKNYLGSGNAARTRFTSRREADQLFDQLTRQFPDNPAEVARLKYFADERRRYDKQARIHFWLHNWFCVHVPLSVALCVVLVFHIVTALKYW